MPTEQCNYLPRFIESRAARQNANSFYQITLILWHAAVKTMKHVARRLVYSKCLIARVRRGAV